MVVAHFMGLLATKREGTWTLDPLPPLYLCTRKMTEARGAQCTAYCGCAGGQRRQCNCGCDFQLSTEHRTDKMEGTKITEISACLFQKPPTTRSFSFLSSAPSFTRLSFCPDPAFACHVARFCPAFCQRNTAAAAATPFLPSGS